MWSGTEPGKFQPRRRPPLELGMIPLIDIVFLLLIFFMLTSSFIVNEGIQVDLPVTEGAHALPGEKAVIITVRSEGTFRLQGRSFTLREIGAWVDRQDTGIVHTLFEIQSDRNASVQSVVSLLELLRDKGASRVTLKTTSGPIE
jgi:biopolymer transport protein ExbD